MTKKIELKVNMYCKKCKTDILKAVTKLEGIDEVYVDGEKGMLIVIGNVDPVCVASRVRKIGKIAEIISVGPPKKPDPPKPPTKPDPPKTYTCTCYPPCSGGCQRVAVGYPPYICPCPPPCSGGCQLVAVGYPPYCDDRGCAIL